MKRTYHKLVRDKIPEIIKNQGGTPVTQILDNIAFEQELYKKLQEEVDEFVESGNIEELADILEVVHALAEEQGVSPSQLKEIQMNKRAERGGFEKKIFLLETTSI